MHFRIKRLVFVLATMLWFTSAQGQSPIIDSLENVLREHPKEDTFHVDVLYQLSYRNYFSNKVLSRKYAESALKISELINYKKGIANSSFSLATNFYDNGDGEKSMQYVLTALKIYQELNLPRGQNSSYLLIGRNYMRSLHLEKAMNYFRRSLRVNEISGDSDRMATDYNYIAAIHTRQKRFDSALFYDKEYLKINERRGYREGTLLGYNNVGAGYGRLGNTSLAFEYLFKALAIADELGNKNRMALVKQTLGETYARINQYKQAKMYLEASLKIATELKNERIKEELFFDLKELESTNHNYLAAVQYADSLLSVKDSLYNSERFKKIAELETYYETEKKEQTIRLLEQEKSIQTLWRNILVGGVVLILVVSYIIFRLLVSRAGRTKELLSVQHEMNDKLKEIDKLKSQFFANISHEFRTPLTLVLAPLEELLKKKSLDQDGEERLSLIKRNANRLLELVNQLLDLSKLEAGKMDLYVRPGNVEPFLKAVVGSFDTWAQIKEIQFIKNFELKGEALWYDQDKLEKMVTNLLANAFKFTPPNGTVTFAVSLDEKSSISMLHICVSDTGKGIAEKEQEKVFLPFYQTHQRTESHHGGTGLGLSLVKELARLYNGEINLQSTLGAGTTICIDLPASKDAFRKDQIHQLMDEELTSYAATAGNFQHDNEIESERENDVLLTGKDSIIIAEDNSDLRNFMVSVLNDKYIVLTAEDGEVALRLALQTVPSLVLTDLMMPTMDGMQLTAKLKADERTSHIPVVLLTAKSEQNSKLAGLKTGADDYLTKPFSTEELFIRINNLIEQRKHLAEKFRERILVPSTVLADISLDDKFLRRIREIVELNMVDPSFTVERMADEAHLSRTQLLRKLKALTGISPNDFIKDLRLKRAAEMILQRADTITQIGYAVGFNDQSYFTKCFKKHFRVTPTEFATQSSSKA
jgi:signal transduction histidine kinase/DNA-binding response OmpR family regulator